MTINMPARPMPAANPAAIIGLFLLKFTSPTFFSIKLRIIRAKAYGIVIYGNTPMPLTAPK